MTPERSDSSLRLHCSRKRLPAPAFNRIDGKRTSQAQWGDRSSPPGQNKQMKKIQKPGPCDHIDSPSASRR